MAVYNFYDLELDSGWNLDDGLELDQITNDTILVESEFYIPSIVISDFGEFEIVSALEIFERLVRNVDILPLVPEKFHSSDILQQYIEVANDFVGTWLGDIDMLRELVDVYSAGLPYLPFLADLINLEVFIGEDATATDLRNQITRTVGWYKIKGTYESVYVALYTLGITAIVYDMYTNDYINFIETLWTAEDEGENPPPVEDSGSSYVGSDLDNSFYKSPHFMLEIVLDRLFGDSLWTGDMFETVQDKMLTIVPVYTVPHYRVSLTCITDESGAVYTTDYDVKTKVWGDWDFTQLYLDMDYAPVSSSGGSASPNLWYLDDGNTLDQSENGFLQSINIWKVGVGNKGVSPDDSGFSGLQSVVATGSVDEIQILSDRVNWIFTLGDTVEIEGISELGLYNAIDELQIVSTFPNLDKSLGCELKIIVTLFR